MLICCIRLSSDWWFRLYHYITYICYFVASYLFSLWFDWFLWRCFVLLLREICVSLLKFPFLSHVQVFLCEISFISHLKRPQSCFSPFLSSSNCNSVGHLVVNVVFDGYNLSSFVHFYVVLESLYWWINALFSPDKSSFPLSFFLDTYSLSKSSLRCNALCIVISFLVLWSICLSSSLVHFREGPKYLTRGTAQIFIPLLRLLLDSFVSRSCLFLLIYSFFFFFFGFHLHLFDGVSLQDAQVFVGFLFSERFIIIIIIIICSFRVFHISISWWFFTGIWVWASLLESPRLFSVFWPSLG